MAPLQYLTPRKVLLYLCLFLFSSLLLCAFTAESEQLQKKQFISRRRLLGDEQTIEDKPKKKTSTTDTLSNKRNQTKLIKTLTNSTKIQTKKLNSTSKSFLKNSTILLSTKTQLKKLNSTSKALNSTLLPKKSSDLLLKSTPPNKNKTITKQINESKNPIKKKVQEKAKPQKPSLPIWLGEEDQEDDLISEFRDLPSKFQQTVIPDLKTISTTSQAYITKANRQMIKEFKPIVGNEYASTIATIVSFAFIIIPLILVSLIINRIKAYFSLQKILIFIQVYLSIYFSILCLSSLVTGLEPLKFFYATSQSTYACLQVMQTLGYVFYLLLLLMYLVLVFSTDCGLGSKMLGLGQTFVGYAVGLHYYIAVFHRVVLHQPPKTNWKVHGIYATCFLAISLFANAERRKKAYLEEGGEEGKKN